MAKSNKRRRRGDDKDNGKSSARAAIKFALEDDAFDPFLLGIRNQYKALSCRAFMYLESKDLLNDNTKRCVDRLVRSMMSSWMTQFSKDYAREMSSKSVASREGNVTALQKQVETLERAVEQLKSEEDEHRRERLNWYETEGNLNATIAKAGHRIGDLIKEKTAWGVANEVLSAEKGALSNELEALKRSSNNKIEALT
ncbi:hypothetical protein THAOC_19160, partial [Thalassiosira oceanica]